MYTAQIDPHTGRITNGAADQYIAKLESDLERALRAIEAENKLYTQLRTELRTTRQELQQLQDETGLEMDGMEEVIAYQDAQLPQMYDQIIRLRSQLNAAYERNLQQGFAQEAAQQEIADWKHSHSDACEMNRRLCLELEAAENLASALGQDCGAAYTTAANLRKELEAAQLGVQEHCRENDRLRQWARGEIMEAKEQAVDGLRRAQAAEKKAAAAEAKAAGFEKQFRDLQAYAEKDIQIHRIEAQRWIDRGVAAEKEAADARRSNNCLLDRVQSQEAKLVWFQRYFPEIHKLMEAAIRPTR